MQVFASLKGKLVITAIVAFTLLFSGVSLAAPADAPAKGGQGSLAASADDGQGKLSRAQTVDEINRYLAQMNPAELAATLKLLRVNRLVKARYIGDVAGEELLAGAVKGSVAAVGDPYTEYMDAKVFKDFSIALKGSFSGVGIELGLKDKQLVVVAPIEGTPAAAAGILSGDFILKIDGKDTKDMAIVEAVNLIRGPEGTQVTLTIGRAGEVRDYTLTRATIQLKTVSAKMLDDGIGYIRLSLFSETVGSELADKLRELESQGLRAVILDLRNNPGGSLVESIKVAENFVVQGPVVAVVHKDGSRDTIYANPLVAKYPLVVLVNGGSASASEIVAGAVQDSGVGTLVGTKTFGKGSVQSIVEMGDGTAVKITTAKYLTPKDRSINGIGIEPDIVVEAPKPGETNNDPQLDKALEVIKARLK